MSPSSPYAAVQRPGVRCALWYVSLLLYYVHIPLLFLTVYMWIAPPAWMSSIVPLTNAAPAPGSADIPGVGFVQCCSAYAQPPNAYFVYGSSTCYFEQYTLGAGQPFDLESVYKPFFPCEQPHSGPWPMDSRQCPSSDYPYFGQYACGLNSLVSSISPLTSLVRFIVAALLLKELLKCLCYARMHRHMDALHPEAPACFEHPDGRLRRMVWVSRNVLMLPYFLRYGWAEVSLRYELEQQVRAGQVKAVLLDLVLQTMPLFVYSCLVFVLSDSVYVLNSHQARLNAAALAFGAALLLVQLAQSLAAFCCCCPRMQRPTAARGEKEGAGTMAATGGVQPIFNTASVELGLPQGEMRAAKA